MRNGLWNVWENERCGSVRDETSNSLMSLSEVIIS